MACYSIWFPLAGLHLIWILFELLAPLNHNSLSVIQQVGLRHITVMKFSNYHLLSGAQDVRCWATFQHQTTRGIKIEKFITPCPEGSISSALRRAQGRLDRLQAERGVGSGVYNFIRFQGWNALLFETNTKLVNWNKMSKILVSYTGILSKRNIKGNTGRQGKTLHYKGCWGNHIRNSLACHSAGCYLGHCTCKRD